MIPQDPMILVSFVNMKLRDEYATLDLLCDDLDTDRSDLERKLREAGFVYVPDINQFR